MRLLKKLRFRLFYKWLIRTGVPLRTLGDQCQWTISDKSLNASSTVLCAGAGHDISFEIALCRDYQCGVVLLDPSPTGIATMERVGASTKQLKFMPVGLGATDGILSFQAPADPGEGSFRSGAAAGHTGFEFPCKSVSTLMTQLDWKHIDLLKMDIEGSEYDVIGQILADRIDVRQICVEFHYGEQFGRSRAEMVRALLDLRRAGFDLVHHVNQDHTFLRR